MIRLIPSLCGLILAASVVLCGVVLSSPEAVAGESVPKLSLLVERLGQSLGGPRGGLQVLKRAPEIDFVFHRVVRDAQSRQDIEAEHRLLRLGNGDRLRLDVRVKGDDGIDSASVIAGSEAWVVAEGERHEAEAPAMRSRLAEFAPERLFSVPLTLATEAAALIGDAALEVSREGGELGDRFVLRGGNEDSPVRIELSAATYRPLLIAFRSLSGDVVYHYEDYREVAPGLILPFVRELHRNGLRVSRTTVRRLGLKARSAGDLFLPGSTQLTPLPKGP
jgi:hypothetical protein